MIFNIVSEPTGCKFESEEKLCKNVRVTKSAPTRFQLRESIEELVPLKVLKSVYAVLAKNT